MHFLARLVVVSVSTHRNDSRRSFKVAITPSRLTTHIAHLLPCVLMNPPSSSSFLHTHTLFESIVENICTLIVSFLLKAKHADTLLTKKDETVCVSVLEVCCVNIVAACVCFIISSSRAFIPVISLNERIEVVSVNCTTHSHSIVKKKHGKMRTGE